MSDLIFVALSTFAAGDLSPLKRLEASGLPFRLHQTGKRITPEELARDGAGAAVIVAGVESYDDGMMERLPALRCISRCGVGVDAIDLAAARQRGITVANTPTVPTQAVAELALAMFLSLSRNLRPQANLMQRRRWERLPAHLLAGRTVGLFGFGRIGRRVAELCRTFGARLLACDPFAEREAAQLAGVELVDREQLLRTADIISLHASRDPAQPVLIGAAELAMIKRGTILVNLARGGMVDEAALVEALRTGQVGGAGLDVFQDEPYQGSLCDFEQVLLTPHSATMPLETRVAMELECVEHAIQYLLGTLPAEAKVV
jgi:D-3-phosphoglycerate dehydrogenase